MITWQRVAGKLNSVVVTVYKVVGLVALTAILLGLFSYFALQGFFLLNHRWVAPTVLGPTDERILQLNSQVALQSAARERLLSERRELEVRRDDVARQVAAQDRFLARFGRAVAADRGAHARELDRLRALRAEHQRVRAEFVESERAYSGLARARADALRQASLMDRERYLTTNYQIAQIAQLDLSLEERGVELDGRTEALGREIRGLDALLGSLASQASSGAVGYTASTLMLEQQFAQATLQRARDAQTRDAVRESLAALDTSVAHYDQLLAALQGSPYLKAIRGNLTVAFVPYENQESARPGVALYGCKVQLLWCRRVGTVTAVLDGEVTIKHPIRTVHLRGVMVEVRLDDGAWAHQELLHAGRAPFLL